MAKFFAVKTETNFLLWSGMVILCEVFFLCVIAGNLITC